MPSLGQFIPAGQLKPSDLLISHDDRLIEVTAAHATGEIATVYNLHVADHHTYFVGGKLWGWDVWVHNSTCRQGSIRQQIHNLDGIVEGNVGKLLSMMTSPLASFRIGGYAQAQRALTYLNEGVLQGIEFDLIPGVAGDLLLTAEKAVEVKSWQRWSTWPTSWRNSKLRNLQVQVERYLSSPRVNKLSLEFEGTIPDEVAAMIAASSSYRGRVELLDF